MKKFLIFLFIFGIVVFNGFSQQNEWYQGKIIKDITFTGLVNVSVKDLNFIIDLYKGGVFTNELFWELQSRLYACEYFDLISPSIERAGKQDSDGIIIRFAVEEKPKITNIFFEGNSFFSKERLLTLAESVIGSRSYTLIYYLTTTINNAYLMHGFRDAKVEYITTSGPNNTCTVTYHINEGYQYVIEAVNFEGNRAISSEELKQCLIRQSKGVFNSGLALGNEFVEDTAAIRAYYSDKGYVISTDNNPQIKENRVEGNTRFITLTYIIFNEQKK